MLVMELNKNDILVFILVGKYILFFCIMCVLLIFDFYLQRGYLLLVINKCLFVFWVYFLVKYVIDGIIVMLLDID